MIGDIIECSGPGCKVVFQKKFYNHKYHNHKCAMAAAEIRAVERHRATYKPKANPGYKKLYLQTAAELERAKEMLSEVQLMQLGY